MGGEAPPGPGSRIFLSLYSRRSSHRSSHRSSSSASRLLDPASYSRRMHPPPPARTRTRCTRITAAPGVPFRPGRDHPAGDRCGSTFLTITSPMGSNWRVALTMSMSNSSPGPVQGQLRELDRARAAFSSMLVNTFLVHSPAVRARAPTTSSPRIRISLIVVSFGRGRKEVVRPRQFRGEGQSRQLI